MNYELKNETESNEPYLKRLFQNISEIFAYIDKKKFFLALVFAFISSLAFVFTPYLLARGIDVYIKAKDSEGLLRIIMILAGTTIVGATANYFQQMIMGKASQAALFTIRGVIFEKIQSLPIAFFSQNKIGDLMSRVNNDSDKLSQFLSESILRFSDSIITLLAIAGFVLYLNWKLALVMLASTIFLLIITRIIAPFLEKANKRNSAATGTFTAGVSEQLSNFKVIIAYNRRNFFESFLSDLNRQTYRKSRLAGFLNQIFMPIYDFANYLAQALVLVYGLFLISQGELTIGLLVGFIAFSIRFYDPLRYVADILGEVQVSLASWGRIRDLLALESNLKLQEGHLQAVQEGGPLASSTLLAHLAFDQVSFGYSKDRPVLRNVSFSLEKGKTYALVGPTGGGKSTIASLMSRLYDPTEGMILWKGKDLRTYEREELAEGVSVILQEPHLFSGTVAENIAYGNKKFKGLSDGMAELLKRIPGGLEAPVESGGSNISIGQKQLISFVRTALREPELLILDEATANIDTVTESSLQNLIDTLSPDTTKIIIAHRLNTIKKADEILFVGGREVKRVSDEREVLELLKGASKS